MEAPVVGEVELVVVDVVGVEVVAARLELAGLGGEEEGLADGKGGHHFQLADEVEDVVKAHELVA